MPFPAEMRFIAGLGLHLGRHQSISFVTMHEPIRVAN